jgi:hypothetical protein
MLSNSEKSGVKGFLEKYEKYFNFQDPKTFEGNIASIINDACVKCDMGKEKYGDAENYIRELYDLSEGEGLSFVLSPGPTFQYTQADQVQRLIP